MLFYLSLSFKLFLFNRLFKSSVWPFSGHPFCCFFFSIIYFSFAFSSSFSDKCLLHHQLLQLYLSLVGLYTTSFSMLFSWFFFKRMLFTRLCKASFYTNLKETSECFRYLNWIMTKMYQQATYPSVSHKLSFTSKQDGPYKTSSAEPSISTLSSVVSFGISFTNLIPNSVHPPCFQRFCISEFAHLFQTPFWSFFSQPFSPHDIPPPHLILVFNHSLEHSDSTKCESLNIFQFVFTDQVQQPLQGLVRLFSFNRTMLPQDSFWYTCGTNFSWCWRTSWHLWSTSSSVDQTFPKCSSGWS